MRPLPFAAIVALALAFLSLPARADTVVLKNGNRFEGRVVSETSEMIVLETSTGEISFKVADIQEIVRAPWTPPGKKPEDEKSGRAKSEPAKKPVSKPAKPPASRPASKPPVKPASKPASKPVKPPASKPAPKPPAKKPPEGEDPPKPKKS